MKREGRQHGMVRSIQIIPPPLTPISSRRRFVLDSPPTAGVFTKVSRKPTNHSKFTGKCGLPRCIACHDRPTCKSKDKVKGSYKVRSNDVLGNHKLSSWRVVDSDQREFDYDGVSGTGVLDRLGDYADYHDEKNEFVGKTVDEDEGWCLVSEM